MWGSWVVDIRKPEWSACVNDTLIPAITAQGFDGIMIDTIDSVTTLENTDPANYTGMKQAAVKLIKDIRARNPNLKIMLNRGFDVLPRCGEWDIDMVLAESIYTDIPAGAKDPVIAPEQNYQNYVKQLKSAQELSPKVLKFTRWIIGRLPILLE